jgi:hypothetical protein
MKPEQLVTLNQDVCQMINEYMTKNNMSLNKFSKLAGVHQNQLLIYLSGQDDKKGLHSGSLKKLGEFMSKKPE